MQNTQQFLAYGAKLFPFLALIYFVGNEKPWRGVMGPPTSKWMEAST